MLSSQGPLHDLERVASERIAGDQTMSELGENMASLPWKIEALRFSFLNHAEECLGEGFSWNSITSASPETVTAKPAMGLKIEEGPWLNGTLSVSKQFGRIDVVYAAIPNVDSFPNAGDLDQILPVIIDQLNGVDGVVAERVGFGGVLLLPVDTVAEGYQILRRLLPFVSFEEDMNEFFLQVNRKKNSARGMKINELSKWSCLSLKSLSLMGDSVTIQPVELSAVRMEFDINNAEALLGGDGDICGLLTELVERLLRISVEGAL